MTRYGWNLDKVNIHSYIIDTRKPQIILPSADWSFTKREIADLLEYVTGKKIVLEEESNMTIPKNENYLSDSKYGNYRLGNRKALSKPKPLYKCNEEGRVFVSITVDKNGNVINAQSGVKGTTNSAPCLLKQAKKAALLTKFNADKNAPSKQIGIIIYSFSFSQ